jgi:hypothetical protein
MTRTSREVLGDHLQKAVAGRLEEDIADNYSGDVVMMSGAGVSRGHEAVRQEAARLTTDLGRATYLFTNTSVAGEYAFLEWQGESVEGSMVCDGADSFHIVEGLIVMQTIHYTVWRK